MSGIDGSALLVALAAALGAAAAVLLLTFAVGVRTGLHRVVDVAWGLAFCAVAVTGYVLSAGHGDPGRRLLVLVLVLVLVWGLRLAGHIWWRGRGHPEDPRYARMLAKAPPEHRDRYALRMVYGLQAALVWLVSLPVLFALFLPRPPGALAWTGTALWAVGLFFEAVGDRQLTRFRADPAHRGRVLDSGLWRYTRHPNYFGDACVWWGLFLLVADAPIGWATVVSPLVMTYLLVNGSGKPMLERQLGSSKPGYADYIARTSGFVPLPPRGAHRR